MTENNQNTNVTSHEAVSRLLRCLPCLKVALNCPLTMASAGHFTSAIAPEVRSPGGWRRGHGPPTPVPERSFEESSNGPSEPLLRCPSLKRKGIQQFVFAGSDRRLPQVAHHRRQLGAQDPRDGQGWQAWCRSFQSDSC